MPQGTSKLSNWLGIVGLDMRPYRWWLVGDERSERRGDFTADSLALGASLRIGADSYRMKRRQSGLRETGFTLMASDGSQRASASQRLRGLVTRETTLYVRGEAFTLSGPRERATLFSEEKGTVGSLEIAREGWTVRQSHGRLRFDATIGEPEQVLLFWVSLYRDLNSGD